MAIRNPCQLLDKLIEQGRETPWLEFKLSNTNPEEIGQYISALSNSAIIGGKDRAFLVFGVSDNPLAKSGTNSKLTQMKVGGEGLQNWLARMMEPNVPFEFHEFECDGLSFSIIEIEPTYHRPVTFKGEAYIRIGEHKRPISAFPEHERSVWLATSRRKFENAAARLHVSLDSLGEQLDLKKFYELRGLEFPGRSEELISGLTDANLIIDEPEGSYAITNLGALLLARDITKFPSVARKTVRVVKYRGRDVLDPVREVTGVLGYAAGFSRLIAYIVANTEQREVIAAGVRSSKSVIPEIAIREIVANALIHQDLNAEGTSPLIEIFDNRIEISNAGAPLRDVDRLIDGAPKSRNELLAEAMRHLGFCEERGRGLDKALLAIEAQSANAAAGLPPPDFRSTGDGFVVTLYGPRRFAELTKHEKLRAAYQHCVLAFLRQDYMSNASLRARFSLKDDDYQAVSTVIAQAIEADLIAPADTSQGRKHAKYVPAWARPVSTDP